jgi:hypothetical protein
MEIEKQIRLRMTFILLAGVASILFGMWNLSKGGDSDLFALMNFGIAGLCFFMYHNMKNRFFPNKEKAWRSYR